MPKAYSKFTRRTHSPTAFSFSQQSVCKMFRPMQLSFGNSAAGQSYKGRSKAQQQLSALHRPAERRAEHKRQQLFVDADGTVSHSAVVAFLTGPAQMMLVHEAVKHSLRLGQQLAGNQVTLPCKPRDWAMVKLPALAATTETAPKKIKSKATLKQADVINQTSSAPASSHDVSAVHSCHQTKLAPSTATPCSDAAAVEVTILSGTEPKDAATTLSTATPLIDDVPLSPATSTPLSAMEESNSSTLCEDNLACTADGDTMWTTFRVDDWTYQDAFKDFELPESSASSFSHNTVGPSPSSFTTIINHSSAESAPIKHFSTTSSYQGMEDTSGNMDVFVEISLAGKAKKTKAQPTRITAASQQEDSRSRETFLDSLLTTTDTTGDTHTTPYSKTVKQPPTDSVQAYVKTSSMVNSSKHGSATATPFVAEASTEPDSKSQSEQQPAAPSPCSSTPSMQLSMAAGGTVKSSQCTLALWCKWACGAAGLRQSVADKLHSLYHWRPAAWAW